MKSFLITFKPATESPRGWPLEKLQALVTRQRSGERVKERWRFNNRKHVSLGDRVFLLLQGRKGPAIIGHGTVVGEPQNRNEDWRMIQFDALVDPTREALVNRKTLLELPGARSVWRSQKSGVLLQEPIAAELGALMVGEPKKIKLEASNPDWTRDELILALDFYLQNRPNPPAKDSPEIHELSVLLNRLGQRLFSQGERADTYRNENGVYMKLMNFRRLDPEYTSEGKTGLARGAKADQEVWTEFADDVLRCRTVARAIIATLDDPEIRTTWFDQELDDGVQEAVEGRMLTCQHIARERNRTLVKSKRRQALKSCGRLICEVCDFDFSVYYGDRGKGFIECHHTKPLATLAEERKTHIDDLTLLCANCHRMIHRSRPWLTVLDLRELIGRLRSL